MEFPQYRKYINGSSYFKIVSKREFEEIQVVGSALIKHTVVAIQFPELRSIQDMLEQHEARWVKIMPGEYDELLERYSTQASS